jgi:hypothetical protein
MRPAWGPSHLLGFAEALAHHLLHSQFDSAGAKGPDLARVVPEAETAWRPSGATAMPETRWVVFTGDHGDWEAAVEGGQ